MRKIIITTIISALIVAVGGFLLSGTGTASGARRGPTATFTPAPTATPRPLSTYVVTATLQPGFPNCADPASCIVTSNCDAGDPVTGGGMDHLANTVPDYSRPAVGGWSGRWYNPNGGETVYAVCLDNPPAHVP